MKKFRYFILVVTGVAAVMLGGCKDKEKYDESAFQLMKATWSSCRILKMLQEQEIQMGPIHRMQQTRRAKRNWMKMALIQIKMKWPSTFMSMAMYPPI